MKRILLFIVLLFVSHFSFGQVLKNQSFEGSDTWGYTVYPSPYNTSGDVWDIVTTLGGTVTSAQDGTYFWGMRDLNNNNGGGNFDHTITFDAVDISSSSNVEISFYYITDGFDNQDYIQYQIFYGDAGSEVGQGKVNLLKDTDVWTKVSESIPNSANSAYIILYTNQNGNSDYAGWDNVVIQSTVSTDSDAEASDTGSQPAGTTISSTGNDDSNNPVDVFEMTFYDWGASDGLPTHVTKVRLKPKNTNTADWTDNIGGLVLDDGINYITPLNVDIADTYIDILFNSGDFDVADNDTRDLNVAVYLNTTNIEDGKILSFMVDVDNHGFTADASGTQFMPVFSGGDFYSNDFTIGVEATEMQFQQQPFNVNVGEVMSPAVTVAYIDANGNVDIDYDGAGIATTSVTTTGTFDASATTTVDAVLGIATFDNLIFSTQGTGLTLTATDDNNLIGTNEQVTSNTFDVHPPAASICHEEHFDGDVPDGWTNNGTANETSGTHAGAAPNCRALGIGDDIYTISFNQPETLEFYQDASSSGNGQTATLEYKIGDNGTWTSLYSFSVTTAGNTETVDLTNVNGVDLSGESDVFIRFSSSFNTWYLDDVVIRGNNCALSIEVLDFSAKKVNSYVLLEWETAQEINNDFFSIEYSKDGKSFKEISQVKTKGNQKENQGYAYLHKTPAIGINYYRLVQYDMNGEKRVFNVAMVYFDIKSQIIRIAPNKVEENLRVEFESPVEKGSLLIYDMEGQLVQKSILASGIDMVNLDVSGLTSGQYVVRFVDVNKTITKKFIKL